MTKKKKKKPEPEKKPWKPSDDWPICRCGQKMYPILGGIEHGQFTCECGDPR